MATTSIRTMGAAALGAALAMALAGPAPAQTIKLWSHWADQESKVAFVESAARAFEQANPGTKVEITWYQKNPLFAALNSAIRAGQAPDIWYDDPDRIEMMENGFLLDLSKKLNWQDIEPWAKAGWEYKGGVYGFPLEASTVELYYNKALMKKLGVDMTPERQLSQAEFLDLVKKSAAAGITPIVVGTGDRTFPGAYVTHELLLKKLGKADYGKLMDGKLAWSDQRVVDTLSYVKQLVDAGAFPKTVTTMKLGEAHYYFHTKPGGLMFPLGSWYTSRAFNPPDKGGQPTDFPLGVMKFPAMDGGACNQCKTLAVQGSYVVNAASKQPDLAVKFLNSMATPEMGNKWLATVLVNTGIKSDPSKIAGQYAPYFRELDAVNRGGDHFLGIPIQLMQGKYKETFVQVVNTAFPAGLISVSDVVKQMDAARGS